MRRLHTKIYTEFYEFYSQTHCCNQLALCVTSVKLFAGKQRHCSSDYAPVTCKQSIFTSRVALWIEGEVKLCFYN